MVGTSSFHGPIDGDRRRLPFPDDVQNLAAVRYARENDAIHMPAEKAVDEGRLRVWLSSGVSNDEIVAQRGACALRMHDETRESLVRSLRSDETNRESALRTHTLRQEAGPVVDRLHGLFDPAPRVLVNRPHPPEHPGNGGYRHPCEPSDVLDRCQSGDPSLGERVLTLVRISAFQRKRRIDPRVIGNALPPRPRTAKRLTFRQASHVRTLSHHSDNAYRLYKNLRPAGASANDASLLVNCHSVLYGRMKVKRL